MTAEPIEQLALVGPPEQETPGLSRGPAMVYARAIANGFRVRISRGSATVEKGAREYLTGEDGKPVTTEKGRRRFTIVKVPAIVASIGMELQHDEHQQGQAAWWVDDNFGEGWAWPLDGSDCRRTILATQLGTLVDLAQLRAQSIAAARDKFDDILSLDAIRARALTAARQRR